PDMAAWLAESGVDVALAEYRGYGECTGVPCLTKVLDDAATLMDALGAAPSEVIVFGRSLGSLAAIELGARHPDLGGVSLDSSMADMEERVRMRVTPGEIDTDEAGLLAALAARFDHRAKLAAARAPLLVIHAANDSMVDASHARRNAEWGRGELVLLPNGD